MSKPASPRDPVSVVIPVHNAADRLEKVVPAWGSALARLGREYDIVVVNDGSTDTTAAVLEKLAAGRVKNLRVITHDTRKGFGACLRTALAGGTHPLLLYTSTDYPYTPTDLRPMLDRIEVRDEVLKKQADLISGCRTGRPKPFLVTWLGRAWRLLARVAAGMHLDPLPAWPGTREYLYNRFVGWVFGVPLADVNSAFKLYRTAFLKRFPIQSDGDFVHAELVAKATFLTSIMDEVPLTPAAPTDPPAPSVWKEMLRVFRDPDFGTPPAPTPGEPGAPAAEPPLQAPVDGSRAPHPPGEPPAQLALVPVV
jgi:glycosyltransferase involved in cell wall biosynthesis